MKRTLTFLTFTFLGIGLCFAQPANDNCGGALSTTPDGTCYGPGLPQTTTVAAVDNWIGTVGCAGNNGEVWFSFVATGTNLAISVTSGTMGGNVEFILVSSTAACAGFALQGSLCGASPLTGNIGGLVVGTTYYYTISSTGADGTFTTCVTNTTPPPTPGQNCTTAAALCTSAPFAQGAFSGIGVAEITSTNTCLAGQEHQAKWYTFTCDVSGTYEMHINPVNWTAPQTGEDFDFMLMNSTAGCYSAGTTIANTDISCNFSGCLGSTGISSTPAATFGIAGGTDWMNNNPPGPGDCLGNYQWSPTVNLVAGQKYTMLIDNYTAGGGGFDLTTGGTAVLGPNATFAVSVDAAPCMTATVDRGVHYTGANMTYSWNFGDGFTSTAGVPAAHTYATTGFFTISLTVTDANGCSDAFSVVVNIGCLPLPIELLTFDAKPKMNKVELNWETATENNNSYFTIERSANAVDYSVLAVISGAGTSLVPNTYSKIDHNPYVGTSYYRLKQTDYDGNYTYSAVRTVEFLSFEDLQFDIVPNPSQSGEFNLNFNRSSEIDLEISIMDVTGKVVYTTKLNPGNGNKFKIEKELSPGMYMIRVAGTEASMTKKLIIK